MQIKHTGSNAPVARKKKSGKSPFRRINDFLHLWLGLITGIIVVIVSITGCIYVFEKEIRSITQPYQFVEVQSKPYLAPSQLKTIAEKQAFGAKAGKGLDKIGGVQYPGEGKAVIASYRDKEKGFMMIYMNPYSGEVLHVKQLERDFFRIILMGHYYLWLPREIGHAVVGWSIVLFVVLLISGIIMWWPKNLKKANRDKSFKIKWKASFKRVNYDLHNVPGFYVLFLALIIALTGLSFSFEWFAKTEFWVASGGKKMPERRARLFSDTMQAAALTGAQPVTNMNEDKVWLQMMQQYKGQGSLQIQFAAKTSDVINVTHNPEDGTFYKTHMRYFDRYSMQEIKANTIYNKLYAESPAANKLMRMNYDMHVGAILGIPGKILAFLASLVCASLPVTGFIIWWGKKKKRKKPQAAVKKQQHVAVKQQEVVLV